NLSSNALYPPPPTRPPVLQARRGNGTLVLEVIDHGPGVPDKLKTQIFEPFQRFDNRKVGGGLGLAVAKGFTEAMGGGIVAAATPGGGATGRITLPVASRGGESMQGAESWPGCWSSTTSRRSSGRCGSTSRHGTTRSVPRATAPPGSRPWPASAPT